jgi:hypothetical protein
MIIDDKAAFVNNRSSNLGPACCTVHDIRQRYAVHVPFYGMIQPLPKRERDTFPGAGTAIRGILKAGDNRQISLNAAQNIACPVLTRVAGKLVTPAIAPGAFEEMRLAQRADNLLQIFNGNPLPFGYVLKGNKSAGVILRQIKHYTQGITAFCGYFHLVTPFPISYNTIGLLGFQECFMLKLCESLLSRAAFYDMINNGLQH